MLLRLVQQRRNRRLGCASSRKAGVGLIRISPKLKIETIMTWPSSWSDGRRLFVDSNFGARQPDRPKYIDAFLVLQSNRTPHVWQCIFHGVVCIQMEHVENCLMTFTFGDQSCRDMVHFWGKCCFQSMLLDANEAWDGFFTASFSQMDAVARWKKIRKKMCPVNLHCKR